MSECLPKVLWQFLLLEPVLLLLCISEMLSAPQEKKTSQHFVSRKFGAPSNINQGGGNDYEEVQYLRDK